MVRRIILDVDPGIDDAMALCWALLNPELEVVAVTACAGNCAAAQATRNVQAIIEAIDPPRWPRLGAAADPDAGLPTEGRGLYGPDGMGGVTLPLAERQHILPSDKVICDHVRAAPDAITIVCLGPLTNLARAFQRDPELPSLVGRVVMMGGTVAGPGNITPAAEFNIYCDPAFRPGRLPLALDENARPPGRDQSHHPQLRPVSSTARRIDSRGPLPAPGPSAGLPRLPAAVRLGGNPRP